MPICPQGHDSPTADYCDYCGWPMSAPGQQAQQPQQGQQGQQPGQPNPPYSSDPLSQQQPGPMYGSTHPAAFQHPPSTTGLVMCPICSTPQTGRYCEECGYDYDLSSPSRRVQQPPPPAFTGYEQPQQQPPQQSQHQPHQQPHQQQGPPPVAQPPVQQPPQQQPGPLSRPQPDYNSGLSQPYQQQPPQQQPQQYQPPQQYQQQPPQQPQQPQYPTGGGNGFSGSGYITGDTGGGGTDFVLRPPVEPQQQQLGRGTWVAVVNADREYFDDMMARSGPDAAGLYFPPYSAERRVPMTGRGQLRIGRRSHQRGTVPEIDLSIAPEDPGASHQHALLQEQPDGGWVLIDQDSTNGTSLNGGADPIAAHQPVPLQDGDRIHVGAWTTITVHRS